jgi:hypothetical protein
MTTCDHLKLVLEILLFYICGVKVSAVNKNFRIIIHVSTQVILRSTTNISSTYPTTT